MRRTPGMVFAERLRAEDAAKEVVVILCSGPRCRTTAGCVCRPALRPVATAAPKKEG